MKLIPVHDVATREKVRKRAHRKLQNIILEFQESTSDTSLVSCDPEEYASASSLSGGLARAVRRLRVDVLVVQRKGKVYLIKGR